MLRTEEVRVARFESIGCALETQIVGIRVDSRSRELEYTQSGLCGIENMFLF